MRRYRHYINDHTRHTVIDAFYHTDSNFVISVNKKNYSRPHLDSNIALCDAKHVTDLLDPSKYEKVTYRESYYDPTTQELLFNAVRHHIFWKSFKFKIRCSRYIGQPLKDITNIKYNWFFDDTQNRINLVLSH